MNNELTSPNLTPEASQDDVLFEAQRLAVPMNVSAHEMLATAAFHENHPNEWLKGIETISNSEAVSSSEPTFATATELFYGQTVERKQPEANLTVEQAIGRIGYIGDLLNNVRDQEELASRG